MSILVLKCCFANFSVISAKNQRKLTEKSRKLVSADTYFRAFFVFLEYFAVIYWPWNHILVILWWNTKLLVKKNGKNIKISHFICFLTKIWLKMFKRDYLKTSFFDTVIATPPTVFKVQLSNFYTIITDLVWRAGSMGFLKFCFCDF